VKIRTLVIAAAAISLAACSAMAFGTWETVRGNGTIRLESRDVTTFAGVVNQGSGLVRFSQGAVRQVTVESDANILPYIETTVTNGVLFLRTRPGISINPTRLVFRITAPDLTNAVIEGSGSFDGAVTATNVTAAIDGSGGISLRGSAKSARFEIDGSGGIDARDLPCVDARVVISGSGSVTVFASGTLDVNISGSGDVRYRGGAKVTVRTSGSGRVAEY
jgi:hypothetical protein